MELNDIAADEMSEPGTLESSAPEPGTPEVERELTEAETARKENVEKTAKALEVEGYKRTDVTLSVAAANGEALLWTIPPVIAIGIAFFLLHPQGIQQVKEPWLLVGALALYFAFIVLHELIHGLVWGLFAPSHFKAIHFGVIWKMITPYCNCSEPLSRRAYIAGAAAPTLVLGVIPAVGALITGSLFWLAVGALLIMSGGGDIAIIARIFRCKTQGQKAIYLDHPYECGFIVFTRPNES